MSSILFTDTLSCTASHGRLALSEQIYDTSRGKSQAAINEDTANRFNADVHRHLGYFETSGDAEAKAKTPDISGSTTYSIFDYKVSTEEDGAIFTRTGLILQNVGKLRTMQLLIWDNVLYYRYITFTATNRMVIDDSQTTSWSPCFVNSITYTASTRTLKLWWNNIGVAETSLPLSSSSSDGLLSASDYKKIFSSDDATSILSRLRAVEEKLTTKE